MAQRGQAATKVKEGYFGGARVIGHHTGRKRGEGPGIGTGEKVEKKGRGVGHGQGEA